MSSVREGMFAEIDARLSAIAGVGSVARDPDGDPAAFPALEIHDDGHAIVETECGVTRYAIAVRIEGFVSGGAGAASGAALSDLYVAVIQALITDPPPGGAESIDEGDLRAATVQLAAEPRKAFALDLTITIATPRGDPSRLA